MNPAERVKVLRRARDAGEPLWAVHYACAGFKHADRGPLPVSAVCFREVSTLAEATFSLTDRKEAGEQYVLRSFFEFIGDHSDVHFLHWNMNRADYGLASLANRYVFLFGSDAPARIAEGRQHDLDDLIGHVHGRTFASHPKLLSLGVLNGFRFRAHLTGEEEAKLFDEGKHGEIKRSCEEKVRLIAFLGDRFLRSNLITAQGGSRILFAGEMLDAVQVVIALGERALDVTRQLLQRYSNRPTLEVNDEYDWQDLFHALLRVFFSDIRCEDPVPSSAGASSRIDFVLPEQRIAVELKHYRPSMNAKTLGEELAADHERYTKHPDVSHVVTLVLDWEGKIANPRGLEKDLSSVVAGSAVSRTVRIYDR
jgi:DpnII restriction endonuclease